jgi:hypothetical protein
MGTIAITIGTAVSRFGVLGKLLGGTPFPSKTDYSQALSSFAGLEIAIRNLLPEGFISSGL